MKHLLLCVLALGFFSSQKAHALFDARLTYGLLASKPDLTALYTGASSNLPTVTPTYGLGADVIVMPPLFPIGFGLRYENMGVDASSNGLEFKGNYTRTSLLLNYRLIDTLIYLGPIFSYGLSHSGSLKLVQNGTNQSDFSSNSMSSYSIGVEAGVKLIGFRVGAEVGYEDFRWNSATDSTGNITSSQNINMSGSYAKVMVGIGI